MSLKYGYNQSNGIETSEGGIKIINVLVHNIMLTLTICSHLLVMTVEKTILKPE